MVLVDTPVRVDNLPRGDAGLTRLLGDGEVLGHPWVVGEIAPGGLRERWGVLRLLQALPAAVVAEPGEVLTVVERHRLHGRGIGVVDAALLASGLLTPDALLWTRDRRLEAAAEELGLDAALR